MNSEGWGDKVIIGSTDIKALYPSLDIAFTIEKVLRCSSLALSLFSGLIMTS